MALSPRLGGPRTRRRETGLKGEVLFRRVRGRSFSRSSSPHVEGGATDADDDDVGQAAQRPSAPAPVARQAQSASCQAVPFANVPRDGGAEASTGSDKSWRPCRGTAPRCPVQHSGTVTSGDSPCEC